MDNKYQNGKIYKVVDVGYNKTYYGSTIEPLCKRIGKHRGHYKEHNKGTEGRVSVYDIFDEFGVENWKIELVELYPCNSITELKRREGEIIKANDCVNKLIAGRTLKEWVDENRTRLNQKRNERRQANPTPFLERGRRFYRENREKILEEKKLYHLKNRETRLEKQQEYYYKDQSRILEQKKEYYKLKKEAINEKHKEKTLCDVCNCYIRKFDMSTHVKNVEASTKSKSK